MEFLPKTDFRCAAVHEIEQELQMTRKSFWSGLLLIAAVAATACGEESGSALSEQSLAARRRPKQQQHLNSEERVLILGSTVQGGEASREALAAARLGYAVDVVTPEQWATMTASQFMVYTALIIGDAACQTGESAFAAAIDNRAVWGSIVDGSVVIIGADPASNATPNLIENAIQTVTARPYVTGMYVALGCAYKDAPPNTLVQLLEPFGTFQVAGVGCASSGHLFQMEPAMLSESITDPKLIGNGCAARSVFTRYPYRTFAFAALGTSVHAPIPGEQLVEDYYDETSYVGTPYILVRGAMAMSSGCGLSQVPSGEECDHGDGLNGIPAGPDEEPEYTCSFSCRLSWCGDGFVDTLYGEECDNGYLNGRDMLGNMGGCTGFCKLADLTPPPSSPPTAVCRDVTVVARDVCGVMADVNNGSSDPDGDLVGCTPSPAGPYPLGTTTVTLTCVDAANRSASCQGIVTVVDQVVPTLTLAGAASEYLECGTGYTDPGATANDLCAGDMTSAIQKTGSVNASVPGVYVLGYDVTDAAGNSPDALTRTVTVSDTRAPQLHPRPGPSVLECKGAPYVDPGATASDSCSGDLTPSITTTSDLDQTKPGEYSVTYRVTDGAGNVGTVTRQLTVQGPCPGGGCTQVRLSDYNLFLLGDYSGGRDVQGKVAAGGNITMTDFSVGPGLQASDTARTLVAGGNLTLSRGGVWGEAWYGGNYSADGTVVFPRGNSARKGAPIDFAARFAELRGLSAQLAGLTANGVTKRETWGGVMLRGTDPKLNVFDVNASAFTGAVLLSINAPAGSLVVVNIRGASATFKSFGHSFSGGIDQHGILYNFVDATSITASNYGFFGTVLAPYAHVNFSNGSWDGGIYAVSLTGNAEGHINVLYDRDICQ
jgi:choice-of-anchor A domain-containing protein